MATDEEVQPRISIREDGVAWHINDKDQIVAGPRLSCLLCAKPLFSSEYSFNYGPKARYYLHKECYMRWRAGYLNDQ